MNYYLKVLQNYATFSGRARRSEYWYFVLFNVIISFVFGFVCGLMQVPELANITHWRFLFLRLQLELEECTMLEKVVGFY
jgi:uncharacterized membrane protein YhaH (DUF805 family)